MRKKSVSARRESDGEDLKQDDQGSNEQNDWFDQAKDDLNLPNPGAPDKSHLHFTFQDLSMSQ